MPLLKGFFSQLNGKVKLLLLVIDGVLPVLLNADISIISLAFNFVKLLNLILLLL